MNWIVELASTDDALAMATVLTEASRDVYRGLVSEETLSTFVPERLAASYRADMARGSEYWVARAGAEVVGMAHAGPAREAEEPAAVELAMIYVLPPFQGNGAARALLEAAVGVSDCFVWVAARNSRALAFYERNGFKLDGASKVVAPLDGIEGLRMVKCAHPAKHGVVSLVVAKDSECGNGRSQ